MAGDMYLSTEVYQKIISGMKIALSLERPPAFAYDRVSTMDQAEGLSLEYQSQGASKYAIDHKIHIIHYFTVVESASKEGRRVFNEMIDAALKFGVKHLVFKSTDRMSRNYKDLARIIDLIDCHDFTIHFYQTNKFINKNSSHDEKFIIGIEQAVAKHLSDKISHDIRSVNNFKIQQGIYCGNAPYGYIYDREHKRYVIDKNTEYILRYIFDEFDSGRYSLSNFCDFLNKNNIAPPKSGLWCKSSIHQTLKNPFYHGEFIHHGHLFIGNQDKYYERDRFEERLKRIAANCVTDKRNKITAFLKKFVLCKCGKFMIPDLKKKQYLYYVHKCSILNKRQLTLTEDFLFEIIDKKVKSISFSPELANLLKELFGGAIIRHRNDRNKDIAVLNRRINSMELKKNKLYELYIDDDYFTRDDLKRKLVEIDRAINSLKSHFKALQIDHDRLQVEVNNVINTFLNLPETYGTADRDKKALILKKMAESIVVHNDNVTIQWKKPYCFFMKDVVIVNKEVSIKSTGSMLPDNDTALTGTAKRLHNEKDVIVSSITSFRAPPARLELATQWLTATCSTD